MHVSPLPRLRTHPFRLLLLLTLTLPVLTRAQVNLSVDATQSVRTVDERVFGINAVMWDGLTGTSQTTSLVQAAGIRAIRVPGGSLSDEYHWTSHTVSSGNWPIGFGPFAQLVTGASTQAFVCVNYGSGTPEEAAAWVAYANAPSGSTATIGTDSKGFNWQTAGTWAGLRAASPLGVDDGMNFLRVGRSSPYGLKYWEIGNECYGTWEYDLQAVKWDPYTYAVRAKDYIARMKAIDPTIKIGVVVVTGEDSSVNNTSHPATNPRTGLVHNGWTPVMLTTLKSLGVTPDYLIYHRYEQAPKHDQPNNPETDAGLLQKAKTWPNDAADLRQQLKDYLGNAAAANVELVVTENNSVYSQPGKQTTSLVNGLFMADSIGNILQTEFNGLLWWDLRNGTDTTNNNDASLYGWRQYGDYGVLSSPVSPAVAGLPTTAYETYPTYYAMKLLSKFARGGDTVVKATSSSSLLSVFAAKRADGSLGLLVINKDSVNTLGASIALTGYLPGGTATIFSYGKPQDDAAKPGGSGLTDIATSAVSVAGTTFAASFGPYSMTVLSLNTSVAPVITTPPVSQTVSVGQSVTFSAAASGTPPLAWQWKKDGVAISGATASSYTIASAVPGDAGSYTVVATNAGGFVTSAAAVLHVTAPVACDFNGDGLPDLLWQNSLTGERAIWLMNGTNFLAASTLGIFPLEWTIAATGDFNGDGQTDIVWSNSLTGERALWLMNGTSLLAASTLGIFPLEWTVAATGDFNGDGKPDLVWSNSLTGERALWLMDGTTRIGVSTLGVFPLEWTVAATGDFNADGKPDIIWSNSLTGERAIWLMNGTNFLAASTLGIFPLEWTVAGTADFNGDGQPDIIWSNSLTGERALWLMNGTTFIAASTLGVFPLEWTVKN